MNPTHPGTIQVFENGELSREVPVAEWPENQRFKLTEQGLIPVTRVEMEDSGEKEIYVTLFGPNGEWLQETVMVRET